LNTPISSQERQNEILQILHRGQRISTEEICMQFSVSEATARRDLDTLAQAGRIQRVHGGAILPASLPPEPPILLRQDEQSTEKMRIGKATAAIINDGETVFLGSGSTVLEVARALRGWKKITVITNSLPVINALAGAEGINLVCLGGMLRESEFSFIGHITEQSLGEVRADKVVMGTRAISLEHGLTHEYLPETLTDRAILKSGKEVLIVADHTKFGQEATVLLAPLSAIQTIVTDDGIPSDFLKAARKAGIRVVTA
jgi:DeoR family transcriptional regulator, aga operon transcriptional repressor